MVPANIKEILNQHKEIYAAIESRNPETAYSAIKRHIEYVIAFFRGRERSEQ